MQFHWLCFHQLVVRMNPGSTKSNHYWQKSISFFLTVLEKFCTDDFSGCFAGDGQNFRHPFCAKFSVAKLYDDGNAGWLSLSKCSTQLTCRNVAVFQNRPINLVLSLRRCRSWSAAVQPVISVPFTAFKKTNPVSNWANIYGILIINPTQMCMYPYGTGAFQSKKLNHLSLPSTYVHNIRHFSLQLCWKQVTDWSIDEPAGNGQCPYRWVWKEILPGGT